LQSSVLALEVVGAKYFSVATVVVVFLVALLAVVARCQTSFLPYFTQTKLKFFVFAIAPTLAHLPPTVAALTGLITGTSTVTKTKLIKPILAFRRAITQLSH
jgi:hypothetical protein